MDVRPHSGEFRHTITLYITGIFYSFPLASGDMVSGQNRKILCMEYKLIKYTHICLPYVVVFIMLINILRMYMHSMYVSMGISASIHYNKSYLYYCIYAIALFTHFLVWPLIKCWAMFTIYGFRTFHKLFRINLSSSCLLFLSIVLYVYLVTFRYSLAIYF